MTKLNTSLLCATAIMGLAVPALAQTAPNGGTANNATDENKPTEEIVVTGTLIRGVAPVGSNSVTYSQQDLQSTGLIDTGQLFDSLVPQGQEFMNIEQIGGPGSTAAVGAERVPLMRPSLRNLGPQSTDSGSLTLVMMDGQRFVPMGITQSTVDIGMLPPGLIDRMEIVLDGASAVYGSDAVAGTINYITRQNFVGTEANVQTGYASNYYQVAVNVTSGTKWDTGNIGLTYSFAKNSGIFNYERPYTIPRNYLLPGAPYTGTACPGYSTVTAAGVSVETPGLTTAAQPCPGAAAYQTLVGPQERNTGFLTLSQDLGERVKFHMSAFYSARTTDADFGPFTASGTIKPTNPYFTPIPGVPTASQSSQSVSFSLAPVYGNTAFNSVNKLQVGQVWPSVTVDLGGNWESRSSFSYGKSQLTEDENTLNSTGVLADLAGTTTATALDPYNVASSSPSLFPGLTYDNHEEGIYTFIQTREVADGPLFALPGGDVRAAIGAEWMRTTLKNDITNATSFLVEPYNSASQDDTGVFGEVNAPLVGPHNSRLGIYALTLDASARFDHYNDFGNTFNPKIAMTYQPVDWVVTRGSWGTSFRAPNVSDKLSALNDSFFCVGPNVPFCLPFPQPALPGQSLAPAPISNITLVETGAYPNLTPEKSKNWSVGMDISPPAIPNLTVSPTFWHIRFTNEIALPSPSALTTYNNGGQKLFVVSPTPAQISAIGAGIPNGSVTANLVNSDPLLNVLYVYDDRTQNLSTVVTDGIDLAIHYSHPTNFGSVDAAFSGTWNLKNLASVLANSPLVDQIATGDSRFQSVVTAGANVGDFRAQVQWQHRSGYAVLPSPTQCTCQTSIGSFDLVNLAFRYNVRGSGPWTKDLLLTLAVNNLLDTSPPIAETTTGSFTNGSTIGRLVTFGVDKKF